VSLLVSTFWSDSARYRARRWETDFDNSVAQAKDLRRALDVLLLQPGVDPARIAYVGHDYGAMFGMLMSAVDPRPKAYALIAPAPRFTDWYLFGSASGVPTGDARAQFLSRFAPIEPINVIGRTKASVFFQFGEMDKYTPRKDFIELYLAGPASKRMATYPSEHEMTDEIIRHDRTAWLAEQLHLPGGPSRRPDPGPDRKMELVVREPHFRRNEETHHAHPAAAERPGPVADFGRVDRRRRTPQYD
jgi:pimeloyl-ACP methyl ester carboxylesterase